MREVESSIERVTVYRQGARVRRRVEVAPVEDTLSIPGLPLALTDGTVRVSVIEAEGGADLVVRSVHVGLYVAPKGSLPEPPDETEIRELERRIEKLDVEREDLELENALLGDMEVPARPEPEEGKAPPASPIAARELLESFVHEARTTRSERRRTIEDEITQLKKRLTELRMRREEASTARRISTREVTKTVVAKLSGSATRAVLALDYHVGGARWAPAYQVRLAKDATSAEIVQRALVCQQSGEDWRGVRLSLSTANPMTWTELPELSALRIGKRQASPSSKRGFRPPPAGASQLYADYDRALQATSRMVPPAEPFVAPSTNIVAPSVTVERQHPAYGGGMDPSMVAAMSSVGGAAPEPDVFDDEGYEGEGYEEEADEMMAMTEMPPPSAKLMRAAPPAPARPAPTVRARRKEKKRSAALREESGGIPTTVLEATIYTQLVLQSPADGARRQRLLPVDRRAQYLDTLNRDGRALDLDVLSVVEQAVRRAHAASDVALPRDAIDVGRASGAFDYTYDADAPVDVDSDGVFHSVPLGTRKSACDVHYVVVPREDENVFRIAEIENPLFAPLLSGPAELYVGDEYVLTTSIDNVAPKGRLTLGLGVEQAIRCARNTRFSEQRTSDAVVATNELVHDIAVELVNNLGRDVRCEVRERIPWPDADAEVVVEEVEVAPAWTRYDQEERGAPLVGGRSWTVKVPARSEVKLSARYVVKIYANNEIVGGNRREA
ncbi:MAG: mucoidy inhibitor MuiA family protein [Deltaproteobacteria bacterium]